MPKKLKQSKQYYLLQDLENKVHKMLDSPSSNKEMNVEYTKACYEMLQHIYGKMKQYVK